MADRIALTSLGMSAARTTDETSSTSGGLVVSDRHGRRLIGALRRGTQCLLEVPRIIAIEQMAQQSAFQIRGPEKPVGDGKCEIHIDLHHQPPIVVGGMMPPQRIDKRTVPHE